MTNKTPILSGYCNHCGKFDAIMPIAFKDTDSQFYELLLCPECLKNIQGFKMNKSVKQGISKIRQFILKNENLRKKIKNEDLIDLIDDDKEEYNNFEEIEDGKDYCDVCNNVYDEDQIEIIEDENGDDLFLCKDCKKEYLKKQNNSLTQNIAENLLTPNKLFSKLKASVIGQDEVLRKISTEVYQHYLKIINHNFNIGKNNIIITGPTGTGKTFMIQKLAELLNVPFISASATGISSTGYKGGDITDILVKLYNNTKNKNMLKYAIVYIDEIDKIKSCSNNDLDVNGRQVQEELLTLIEGQKFQIEIQPGMSIEIDTSNMLFICGGAFSGIEEIVKKRLGISNNKTIGFANNDIKKELTLEEIRKEITYEDLNKYGLISEFIGRFSIIGNLKPLSDEDLIHILERKGGLIEEYTEIFKYIGKKLSFKPKKEVLSEIVDITKKKKTGARGLRSTMNLFMSDLIYTATDSKYKNIIITPKLINSYKKENKVNK